jgi:hypothetical protein
VDTEVDEVYDPTRQTRETTRIPIRESNSPARDWCLRSIRAAAMSIEKNVDRVQVTSVGYPSLQQHLGDDTSEPGPQ